MPSSVALGLAWAMDGATYSAETFRQAVGSGLTYDQGTGGSVVTRPGVLQAATRMLVQAGSGMTVVVNGGVAVVPSGVSSVQGAYLAAIMAQTTLTVATSDPTNPRVDAVLIYIDDLGTTSDTSVVEVLAGTPTPGANLTNLNGAPSLPNSSLLLAYVLVPAGSSSVTGGNISDQRTYTVAPGGILPLASTTSPPAGNPGQFAYDGVNDRIFELGSSGPSQAKVLPWAPQFANGTSNTFFGTQITVGSVSVTVDGSTDLEIHACWRGFIPGQIGPGGSGSPVYADFSLYVGSTQLKVCRVANYSKTPATFPLEGGGAMFHYTQGGTDRPAAGTHVVSLQYFDNGTPYTTVAGASMSEVEGWELYVRPVPL